MNLLNGIFSEKSSRSSFYLDFEEKVWELGRQSVGNDVKTANSVSTGHFDGEKSPLRKPFSDCFFSDPKKCGRFVEDFDGAIESSFLRVQNNNLRSAFQKLSSFFSNLWKLNQSCWTLAKTFPKVV